MSRIKDEYQRWMLEALPKYDMILVLGALIWLKWCEELSLPLPNLKSPAFWTSPVFLIVGAAAERFYSLSAWWQALCIRWVFRIYLEEMF